MSSPAERKQLKLTIEPPELRFSEPFQRHQKSTHTLTNASDVPVAIKIKTNNNQRFLVSQRCAQLQPGERLDVSVSCRPFVYDRMRSGRDRVFVYCSEAPWNTVDPVLFWKTTCKWKKYDMHLRYVCNGQQASGFCTAAPLSSSSCDTDESGNETDGTTSTTDCSDMTNTPPPTPVKIDQSSSGPKPATRKRSLSKESEGGVQPFLKLNDNEQ